MTRLKIKIEACTWKHSDGPRSDQARRARLAALLRDMAGAVERGSTGATLERPDLIGSFQLELPGPKADAAT